MIGHYGHCRDEEHDEYAEAEDPFVDDRAWRGNVEIEGRERGSKGQQGLQMSKTSWVRGSRVRGACVGDRVKGCVRG